jgi:transposase
MLTQGEDVEAHALHERGWTISQHLDRDRKTIRAYLTGQRQPGKRKPVGPDGFAVFEEYCRIRLKQDPHLQASTLLEEQFHRTKR